MDEDNIHEQRKLNPNNQYSEHKNKKQIIPAKLSTLQFYIIIIILLFLIYRFCFTSTSEKNNQENSKSNSSKSKNEKIFYNKLILNLQY